MSTNKVYRFSIIPMWGPNKDKTVARCYRYNGSALTDEDTASFIGRMETEEDVLRFIKHGMRGVNLTITDEST